MYKYKRNKLSEVIITVMASAIGSHQALAQEQSALEEVTVTGIRASLERSMDIKRESSGVVDAISAEDIGKFPDTNLAESLQRITGVSINRVNGEGSEVTVRGFGPGFNLVTLNGRQMPAANVATVGGDQDSDFATGTSRSFDFSNLASEGVSGLEVYKTGRASNSSGGIGATVNIKTVRPLDDPGTRAIIGAKAMHDTGVDFDGDDFTPETSGLFSWTNEEETLGVSLFGSFQERHGGSRSATVNDWDIRDASTIRDGSSEFVGNDTVVNNLPADAQWVSIPKDSRYHVTQAERERQNGQLTVQFRPREDVTLTLDALYAKNSQEEHRTDQTNWFNAIRSEMTFDGDSVVSSPVFQDQDIPGDTKDIGFEQQLRSQEDELKSFGFNAEWDVNDNLSLAFDVHSSKSESNPNGPLGTSSILFGIGAFVVDSHSLDISSGFPKQSIEFNDEIYGNGNGVLDASELSSSVARTVSSSQEHEIDQFHLSGSWEFDNGRADFGIASTSSDMTQARLETTQTLGGWGNKTPDIPTDLVEEFCLTCEFEDFNPGENQISAFRGDAGELYMAMAGPWSDDDITNIELNMVEEDVLAAYFQFTLEGELGGFPTRLVLGTRYETTDSRSTSLMGVPEHIVWESDNDFGRSLAGNLPVSFDNSYDNLLPSIDFSVDLREDLVGRVSYSKTIARPSYGDLFASNSVGNPSGPTALGAVPNGDRGNPFLLPLESSNYDLSLEWYYGDSSYVSAGFYEKRVANFVGTSKESLQSMDLYTPDVQLRDVSSGAEGSRSGDALALLDELGADRSEAHLFTMTALLDNFGAEAAKDMFSDNMDEDMNLPQAYVDEILTEYDLIPNEDDPLMAFDVSVPVNNKEAKIYGFEVAAQHFFGDSGFGVQANMTTVRGDIGFDRAADPSETQFALLGLSDSANLALIYENFGLSARLAYNWRDQFLSGVNRGASNNPIFVDDYGQWDMNVSYEVTDNLTVLFEGLNLTSESMKTFARDESNIWFAQELDARYLVGAQYRF